jgi:hypothetical protein
VKAHLGDALIGRISRDATAIEAREKPKKTDINDKNIAAADLIVEAEPTVIATVVEAPCVDALAGEDAVSSNAKPVNTDDAIQSKSIRKKKSTSAPPQPKRIEAQLQQTLAQMLDEIPKGCDRGSKCNAQGYKNS